MLIQILRHTPTWVFIVFGALIWLGLNQTRARTASIQRVTILPLAMVTLSIYGMTHTFDAIGAYAAWATACVVVAALWLRYAPARNAYYDAVTARFSLPGSWLPLALICGVFVTKYAVGASLAIHPQWRGDLAFAVACATLYGAMSGLFLARTMQLWQIARRTLTVAHA